MTTTSTPSDSATVHLAGTTMQHKVTHRYTNTDQAPHHTPGPSLVLLSPLPRTPAETAPRPAAHRAPSLTSSSLLRA